MRLGRTQLRHLAHGRGLFRSRRGRLARRSLVGICLILAVLPSGDSALAGFDVTDIPPTQSFARPRFQVEAASRIGIKGADVTLAFKVPYGELVFEEVKEQGKSIFVAEFDLIILLYDGKHQVGGDLWNEELRLEDEEESRSQKLFFQKIVTIPSGPGDRRAEVTIREPNSGRGSQAIWDLEVPDYSDEKVSISSLWIAKCRDDFIAAPSFPPDGWILSHRFGQPLDEICIVGELYRKKGEGPAELTWRILDIERDEVMEQTVPVREGRTVPFIIQPDLNELWLGSYYFEVQIEADGRKARRRFEFRMDETMISLSNNLQQSLELLRLVAKKEDIEKLEALPAEERQAGWDRFWEKYDPTPGTADNEFKDQFFQRVSHANENFGVLEPGWKSDRGRIYIKFGSPDDIQTRPSTLDGLAVEIWTYNEVGRRFVFVDYDGFGRYELYQPGRS